MRADRDHHRGVLAPQRFEVAHARVQAQLAAAKQNAADDGTKIAALTRERDAAAGE